MNTSDLSTNPIIKDSGHNIILKMLKTVLFRALKTLGLQGHSGQTYILELYLRTSQWLLQMYKLIWFKWINFEICTVKLILIDSIDLKEFNLNTHQLLYDTGYRKKTE